MSQHWKITPHEDSELGDYAVMPADTDEQHDAALSFMHDRIINAWDGAEVGKPVSVTIELCEGPCPLPEGW